MECEKIFGYSLGLRDEWASILCLSSITYNRCKIYRCLRIGWNVLQAIANGYLSKMKEKSSSQKCSLGTSQNGESIMFTKVPK